MYLENRLIAMLDVLGFAGRIATPEALQQTTNTYAGLIDRAKTHMFSPPPIAGSPNPPPPNFEYGQFSFDTLVLVSHAVDIKAAYRFIFATILLMEQFFAERFPLRGCIGVGNLCGDDHGQIVLSDAFKRLDSVGGNQQWTGCVLLEDAAEIVLPYLLGPSADRARDTKWPRSAPLHWCPVPLKQPAGSGSHLWCLNWSYLLAPATIVSGLDYMKGDPAKLESTSRYLAQLANLEDDALQLPPPFLPAKTMRVMKARSGCRIKTEDEHGNGVRPGCAWSFAAYDQPGAIPEPNPAGTDGGGV